MSPEYVQRHKDAIRGNDHACIERSLKFLSYIMMRDPEADIINYPGPYEFFPRTMARLGFPPSFLRWLGRKRFLEACEELVAASNIPMLSHQATYIHTKLTLLFSELRYLHQGPQQDPFIRKDVFDRRMRSHLKKEAKALLQTLPGFQQHERINTPITREVSQHLPQALR